MKSCLAFLVVLTCCGGEPVKLVQEGESNGRFVVSAGEVLTVDGDVMPMMLKIDTQTGETWKLIQTRAPKLGENVFAEVWVKTSKLEDVLSQAP